MVREKKLRENWAQTRKNQALGAIEILEQEYYIIRFSGNSSDSRDADRLAIAGMLMVQITEL